MLSKLAKARKMTLIAIFVYLATVLSTTHARYDVVNPIRLPLPRSAVESINSDCLSWRLAVEAHNIRNFLVSESCLNYIEDYMLGKQYFKDCDTMAVAAEKYAASFPISGDGKDVWVFDIDETLLSNLIFFASPDVQFGTKPINATAFYEWLEEAAATPIPGIFRLYNKVLSLGFKTVLLTGASEPIRKARIANLKRAGYHGWDTLFLRGENDLEKTQEEYKSEKRTELVNKGYRIVGNVGDQWSDLVGDNIGNRTFKVPNPMYYAP